MSRPVIPPSAPPSPSHQTVQVLEGRLHAAEKDTQQLIDTLNDLGFSQSKNCDSDGRLSPFKARLADTEILQNNYETLVSRVCRTESAIQTMKLGLLNLQGNKDLQKKIQAEVEEKLQVTRQNYESEISKLTRKIKTLKDDLVQEIELKNAAKEEIKQLRTDLEEAVKSKTEATMSMDDYVTCKQKLSRRVSELKEELAMEKSLRSSLEHSHNTLLSRVRDMETVVESEREEVGNINSVCSALKAEVNQLKTDLSQEQILRQQTEESYNKLNTDTDDLKQGLHCTETEKQLITTELDRLRLQYDELISQLEEAKLLMDQHKEKTTALEKENKDLKECLLKVTEDKDKYKQQHKKDVENEKARLSEKINLEEESVDLRTKVKDLGEENLDLIKKIAKCETELYEARDHITCKEKGFTSAASALENELLSLRDQLQKNQSEKEALIKDKESLLEEVNHTVDSMMEERKKLQNDLEDTKLELNTLYTTQAQLERENADLIERLGSVTEQQSSQKKIEETLKDMLDQKNKLAYENGKLQSQVTQMRSELQSAQKDLSDVPQLRKLSKGLQDKYSKAHKDMSETKILVKRLEHQLKQSQSAVQLKEEELQQVIETQKQLEKQIKELLSHIEMIEGREKHKVSHTQKHMEDARAVNREIAGTLEAVMTSHSQLQTVVESLQVELGKKDTLISQLKNQKNREHDEMKHEIKEFESRMEKVREELKKEREKSIKKTSRDISEMKKQNDSLASRNSELVKTNTELRHKMSDKEKSITELQTKVTDQKHKMAYLHKAKKHLEENLVKMKAVKEDMNELESMRDQYIAKNKEQADTIKTFMKQISGLQSELKQLAEAQANTNQLLQQKENALEKERKLREEMKKKYSLTKKREEELYTQKESAEDRLKEAHNESLEISQHLQDAHQWFKGRFDKLQKEIVRSRQTQAKLEEDNAVQTSHLESEKRKAQRVADKAKDMIKESRETITRLATYADFAEHENKNQMRHLENELEFERESSKYTEMKHQNYKAANSRHLDQMIRRLENQLHIDDL
ncbi:hypothetical protein SNE40_015048 [Patella caerulea]|uniref:Coiled-coil domain-containing protein 150 n=1 Tax=Patella caerulea TaxID=87958 RepID=A0AAN8PUJ7_PATCE